MPELPEVQTTVQGIIDHVKGMTIKDAWTSYNSPYYKGKDNIKDPVFFKFFKKIISGGRIENAQRRGKNVLIHLHNKHTIIIHLKMTGHLLFGKYKKVNKETWKPVDSGPLQDPYNRFIRFVIDFGNDKHLALSDMRKFAKVTVTPTSNLETVQDLSKIGPEPLSKDFDFKKFHNQLKKKTKGKIKTTLMDQEIVAGIGNIYSDEILWDTNIHPLTLVKDLDQEHIKKILKSAQKILQKSISLGGDSMSDYRNIKGERGQFQNHHKAYKQNGKTCTKNGCKGIIQRMKIGGRSAHFCNTHQIYKK